MSTESGETGARGVGMKDTTFEFSCDRRDDAWDDFVGSVSESHFEQTSGWGAIKAGYGWEVSRIRVVRGGQTVGGVQVLIRRLGRIGKVGYVARGPVILPGFENVGAALVELVERQARKDRWLYCVFDYPYRSHALAAEMAARGYFAHPPGIPPSDLLTATTLIDLSPPEEKILQRMNRKARHDVRASLRSELVFAVGGRGDLPRFRELMVATCERRRAAPTPPQKDYFDRLWSELGERGWVRLFLVRCGDEIVSAVVAFTISDTIRLWKYGWSGAYPEKHPNHLLYWEVMRWAKARGFRTLDFVWIDTEDARRIARGELSSEGFRDGTTSFKLGFGGTLDFPPPVQSRIFHPLFRLAYRGGGARILKSKAFQWAVARYWSQAAGR